MRYTDIELMAEEYELFEQWLNHEGEFAEEDE